MSAKRTLIGARPGAADRWVARRGAASAKTRIYTARITIDVTPELRARIKLAAFSRGVTVADMLRALLEERFPAAPNSPGPTP